MHPYRFLCRAGVAAGIAAAAAAAHAGTLTPALERLARSYARQFAPPAVHQRTPLAPRITSAGLVQVYVHYRAGRAPSAAALSAIGAKRVRTSSRLGVVQAWVPVARLHEAAGLAGVTRVGLPLYGYPREPVVTAAARSSLPSGLHIDADAITAERVTSVHKAGITGGGVKVGVISDGVDGLSASQNAGYLPSNVWVDSALPGAGAEGTAMLELVHAQAPGASLGFCGPDTTVEFLQCYDDLAQWGAHVIVDDLGFPGAFIYADPDAQGFLGGITTFAQNHPDINLATAAGNDRQDYFGGAYVANTHPNIVSLTPTYQPQNGGVGGRTYMSAEDFGLATGGATDAVEPVSIGHGCSGGCQLLAIATWDDPLNGPYDDFDLFLVKSDGTVVTSSTFDQTSNAQHPPGSASYNPPAEALIYSNTSSQTQTRYLAVLCYACAFATSSDFHLKLFGNLNGAGTFTHNTDGSVAGHSGLAAELTVAAAGFTGTSTNVTARLESFSATGPYVFGDWQSGAQTRSKPDVTGIDGVTVSGAGGFSSPFFGTSAAAPNAAAVIALLRSGFPGAAADANGWNDLLTSHADAAAITNYQQKAAGAGLADAQASAVAQDSPLTGAITKPAMQSVILTAGDSVTFAADCTYAGQFPVTYDWRFGAGSGVPDSNKLAPASVNYSIPGTFTVRFTCSDGLQSAADTRTIEVQSPPPPSNGGGGGGGGFGGAALGLLAALAWLARRRR